MKVIFLDHDGVICLSQQWGGRFKKAGFDSNPETPLDIRMDNFDKKAIKVLNEIIASAWERSKNRWRFRTRPPEAEDY